MTETSGNRGKRIALWVAAVIVALVVLYFLFEWAGVLLDSGGSVGV
ncbi:hypothetical protein BH18ACT5_BH18ACT5_06470 [soil metagenome]